MKSKKNKMKKFILLILLLIIICLGLIIYNKSKSKNLRKISYEYNQEESKQYLEERVLPRNTRALSQYKGNIKKDDLYSKLNVLVNILIEINNNTDKTVEEYFNTNKEKLEMHFIDIDLEKFENIVNKISFDEIDEFLYAEIMENFILLDNYCIFEISLNYKNNKKIIFETYMKNEATGNENDIMFKFVD